MTWENKKFLYRRLHQWGAIVAYRVLLAATAGLALATSAAGQLVVSGPGDRASRPIEVKSTLCSVTLSGGRIGFSRMIWIADDHETQSRVGEEFEAFAKTVLPSADHGNCVEYASYNSDPKTEGTLLATGWTGGYPTDRPSDSKRAKAPLSPKSTGSVGNRPEPASSRTGPTPNQLKYQRELEAHKTRLAEIEQIKARTASKHAAGRAAAERELARHRQELAVADAAQRRYREDVAQHQRTVNEMQNASGNCRMVRESANNGPFATEAEAIAKTVSRIPSDGRQVGAATTSWLNVALGENGRKDYKPGLRGYMASVPYERRLCFGKAATGSAR